MHLKRRSFEKQNSTSSEHNRILALVGGSQLCHGYQIVIEASWVFVARTYETSRTINVSVNFIN